MTRTELVQPTIQADTLVASVSADGVATVVTLRGEADLFTLPVLVDVLARVIADQDGPVIIDLGAAKFIDSSAVRAFARASLLLTHRGRALTLRSPSTMAVRVLGLLGLAELIDPGRTTAA